MNGNGVVLVLTMPPPQHAKIEYPLRFGFHASNNEAEYKDLLAGLQVVTALEEQKIVIYSDSQLAINQVTSSYQAKANRMGAYLCRVHDVLEAFSVYCIIQISRSANSNTDSLAHLASATGTSLSRTISVEFLLWPSILTKEHEVHLVSSGRTWMDVIVNYLKDGVLPQDKFKAKQLWCKCVRYTLVDEVLYKRGFTAPSLRCLDPEEVDYVMCEIQKGICENHSIGRALVHNVFWQGCYWPTLNSDAIEFVRRYDKCQHFSHIPHQPPVELTPIRSLWPFAQWGVDLICPFSTAKGKLKYAVVAVDYFTKWAEVEILTTITENKTTSFIWRSAVASREL